MFADDVPERGSGPRRNSEGSPNFMTCAGSPRFHRRNAAIRKRFPSRSEEDESMEEEDEEMEEEIEDAASNVFDFEDVEDFDDVVDYRPRGEIILQDRRRTEDTERRLEKYPGRTGRDHLQNDETSFLTLDSLDEEVDSDESGYVEAPPKSLLQDDRKDDEVSGIEDARGQFENDVKEADVLRGSKESLSKVSNELEQDVEAGDVNESVLARDRADFIKCPISETIRKLANASLRGSKSMDMSANNCLKALSNLKTSKSFDGVAGEEGVPGESPSLHQRKQLLAQHGVIV